MLLFKKARVVVLRGLAVSSGGESGPPPSWPCWNVGNHLPRPDHGLLHLLSSCNGRLRWIDTLYHLLDEVLVGTGELEVLKALPLVHFLHYVQEAVVEHSHFGRCNKELLDGIIVCLDAVCRVVLPEVEHTTCKNSRISWEFLLDWEWIYNIDNRWNPTVHIQLVLQLECEWICRRETESTVFTCREIRRTLLAWMLAGLEHSMLAGLELHPDLDACGSGASFACESLNRS